MSVLLFCVHFALNRSGFSSLRFSCRNKKRRFWFFSARDAYRFFVRDDVTFNRWSGITLNAKIPPMRTTKVKLARCARSRYQNEGRRNKEWKTFGQMKSKFYVLRLTFEVISGFTCPQLEQFHCLCAAVLLWIAEITKCRWNASKEPTKRIDGFVSCRTFGGPYFRARRVTCITEIEMMIIIIRHYRFSLNFN